MGYYVSVDGQGFGTGYFSEIGYPPQGDKTRNAAIPSSAISVSEVDFYSMMAGTAKIVNGVAQPCSAPVKQVAPADIDTERDRRMYGGFVFEGVVYQTDPESIANVTGAATLALMAVLAGAKPGDFFWTGAAVPFSWIAANNSFVQMDAQTVVEFAKATAAFRSQMIYMARVMKNELTAGQQVNLTDDASWGVDSTSPTSTAPKSSAEPASGSDASAPPPTGSTGPTPS